MARLSRLVLMLCAVFGLTAGAPAESHAGVIPWMYDAIFGPVGSVRANRVAYAYSGSPAYSTTSLSYAPMSVGYTPSTMVSYGYAPSYGSGCACNQPAASYPAIGSTTLYSDSCSSCGTSGCSSCSSGNCSTGSSSIPVTSGYGPGGVAAPTPDPSLNSNSRDLNSRLNDIEYQLKVLDHRQKEDEKFLDRQYEGKYAPSPYSSGTYGSGRTETVPPRQRKDSFDSSDQMYTPRRRAPAQDPLEQGVNKPDLTAPAPAPDDEKSNKSKGNNGAVNSNETEPQAMNLDHRITSRAVAPRERMQIVTKESKLQAVANLNKKAVHTSDKQQSTELARH